MSLQSTCKTFFWRRIRPILKMEQYSKCSALNALQKQDSGSGNARASTNTNNVLLVPCSYDLNRPVKLMFLCIWRAFYCSPRFFRSSFSILFIYHKVDMFGCRPSCGWMICTKDDAGFSGLPTSSKYYQEYWCRKAGLVAACQDHLLRRC